MELVTSSITAAEFKSKILSFIKSKDLKAELLRQIFADLPDDKRSLFEKYQTDSNVEPISEDCYQWEREGGAYFASQLHMAKINFCLERLEHLIQVKSYLTERGIAGFPRPVTSPTTSYDETKITKEKIMITDFSSVDLTGFTPSRSLSKSANSDDLSSVRISLFMEMNDKRLSTVLIIKSIAWALSKYPNLFVVYEENAYAQQMEQDKAKWNPQYYHMQELYTTSNFSLERIKHMINVREHVFKIAQNNTLPQTQPQSSPKQLFEHREKPSIHTRQSSDSNHENSILKSFLIIGGVVAAIALVIFAVIV